MDIDMLEDASSSCYHRKLAPALPPELILMILDYHEDRQDTLSWSTLLSCSLVSRIWRGCASYFIFNHLVIPRRNQPMNLRMVPWLLDSAPIITHAVQHLVLTSVHPAQHVTQDVLVSVLARLPRLKTLEMKGVDDRSILSSRGEAPFKRSLKLEKLSMHLSHMVPFNDIINTLELFSELSELCLEQHLVPERPPPVYPPPLLSQIGRFPRGLKLRSLKLQCMLMDCTLFSLLELKGPFDDLTVLEVFPQDEGDLRVLQGWLTSPAASKLRHLKVDVSKLPRDEVHQRVYTSWGALNLSHCPSLHCLTFSIDPAPAILYGGKEQSRYVPPQFVAIEQILLRSPLTLRNINFRCRSVISPVQWPTVFAIVSRLDMWLRRFKDVASIRWECSQENVDGFESVTAQNLQTFAAITQVSVL